MSYNRLLTKLQNLREERNELQRLNKQLQEVLVMQKDEIIRIRHMVKPVVSPKNVIEIITPELLQEPEESVLEKQEESIVSIFDELDIPWWDE